MAVRVACSDRRYTAERHGVTSDEADHSSTAGGQNLTGDVWLLPEIHASLGVAHCYLKLKRSRYRCCSMIDDARYDARCRK